MKKALPEQYLIEKLKEAIIAEKTAGAFYKYISEQIRNGRIRNRFRKMAEDEAERHKDLLNDRLKEITNQTFEPNLSKIDRTVEVSKFSLIGALKMAKESEADAIDFYKKAKSRDEKKHRKMYEEIIKDEKKHWRYLDNEKKFVQERIQRADSTVQTLFSILISCYK